MSSINKNIPSKTCKPNQKLPWFTNSLKRLIRKKQKLYNKARESGNWDEYKRHQKFCKREIKQAEWSYINSIINDGIDNKNNKSFWKYIKSKKQDNIGIAPLKLNNKLVCDSKLKANILINQFKSIFTPRTKDKLPQLTPNCHKPLPPLIITTNGVKKLLDNLNVAKATGPDNLPTVVLKTCSDELAAGLSTIFACSLISGQLPVDWRNANVASIHKKGDVNLAENYRPVSLTSQISKLLEHIICKHLLDHLDRNHILTNLNHGFRKGFSCETQLIVTMDDLLYTFIPQYSLKDEKHLSGKPVNILKIVL